jgi:hypothetical protein
MLLNVEQLEGRDLPSQWLSGLPCLHPDDCLPGPRPFNEPAPSFALEGGSLLPPDGHTIWYSVSLDIGFSFRQQAQTAIPAALSTWASVTGLVFKQMDDNGPSWAPDLLPGAVNNRQPYLRFTNSFLSSDELANAGSPTAAQTATVTLSTAFAWSNDVLAKVLLHEIGHTLGLAHEPTPLVTSVMQAYYGAIAPTLQAVDIWAAHALYGPWAW